jgi:1-acyl-sn-glycerol-3-phosphate acyltransferase
MKVMPGTYPKRGNAFGGGNLMEGWQTGQGTLFGISLRASLRAALRLTLIALWTLIAMPIQALLPAKQPKIRFARVYWATICRLLGLHVRLIGTPPAPHGRPIVYISNHSSWLDIPALGGQLPAVFVSKEDVDGWPIVRTIARLGRTIFVSRNRQSTARERDDMRARLAGGDSLILFPEGTSSDGSRVLPFRSSFFAIAEGPNAPLIQPVSLVYDRLAGLPMVRATRPLFAWYGNMELAPHAWQIAQQTGCRASLVLHPPIDPVLFTSRKALAAATWQTIADGAALLRQNRQAPAAAAPAQEIVIV